MGYLNPSSLKDQIDIECLRDYAIRLQDNCLHVAEGAFHFIVDTGCSCTASPFKEDFEELILLPKPITLSGIAGNAKVTHGGVIRLQCINTNGAVFTIRTKGFYNPNQKVRLFRKQAYFATRPNKDGQFTISWSKIHLSLYNFETKQTETLPCHID